MNEIHKGLMSYFELRFPISWDRLGIPRELLFKNCLQVSNKTQNLIYFK